MEDWELDFHWGRTRNIVKERMNQETLPDLNTILLLIGVQEAGKIRKKYSKEEKQDLMHVAVCHLLEPDGYYSFLGFDEDGWPHWDVNKPFTLKGPAEQERYLKERVIAYFDNLLLP